MEKIDIKRSINTNCVRYDVMKGLIDSSVNSILNPETDHMNIYIDLYPIYKALYNDILFIEDYSDVTSCVINICAHYRAFFESRYKTETTFYIISSFNLSMSNAKFDANYNYAFRQKYNADKKTTEMISNNLNLLRLLCPYLPDIHFIERDAESAVVMYDIMLRNTAPNIGHMVISKDIFTARLTAMVKNTVALKPVKRKQEDLSYIISAFNLNQEYMSKKKCKTQIKIINPALLTWVWVLNGGVRDLPTMVNITKSITVLEYLISDGIIPNTYSSDFQSIAKELSGRCKCDLGMLENRFKALDIQYQHQMYISNPLNIDYVLEMKNLNDGKAVREINDTYFRTNPLDLMRL